MEKSKKSYWELLAKGVAHISASKIGKGGNELPNLQILLPDNQRIAIWLKADKGTANWQLVQDTDDNYRNDLETGGTLTTTEAVDDDLPF